MARQGEMMSISPNVPEPSGHETNFYEAAPTPRWIIVVFVAAFAIIGYLLYARSPTKDKLGTAPAQANSKEAILSLQNHQTTSPPADLKSHLAVTTQKR